MHIQKDRQALLKRLDRLQGQLAAVRRLIEKGEDSDSYSVMHQFAAARGALDGVTRLFVEGHIREHLVGARNMTLREEAGEQLIKTLQSFLK